MKKNLTSLFLLIAFLPVFGSGHLKKTEDPKIEFKSKQHAIEVSTAAGGADALEPVDFELTYPQLTADVTVTLLIAGGDLLDPQFLTAVSADTKNKKLSITLLKGTTNYKGHLAISYKLPTLALTADITALITLQDKPGPAMPLIFKNKKAAVAVVPDVPIKLTNNSIIIPVMTKLSNDAYFGKKVDLEFTTTQKPATESKITLLLKGDEGDIKPTFVLDAPATSTQIDLKISSGDWKLDTPKKNYKYIKQVLLNYQAPKTVLSTPKVFSISFKDNDNGLVEVRFENAVEVTKKDAFWMEVGANFDLLDGLSANNLYAGVLAFEKDINQIKIGNKSFDMSYTGGVYESKASSLSNSSDSGLVYRDGRSYIKAGLGYPYYRDTGSFSTTTTVQSIGLFFSPHIKLSDKKTSEDGMHIYVSLYTEMLWQRVKSKFDYSKTKNIETLYEPTPGGVYKYDYKENSINMDFRSHYFGIGLPIYISDKDYTIYLNPVFGITSQRFAIVQSTSQSGQYLDYKTGNNSPYINGFLTPKSPWNGFYIAQFRLTSETYGISFTGEVRGFLLQQSKPIISLSLSKKFDPGRLFSSLFGSPNTSK